MGFIIDPSYVLSLKGLKPLFPMFNMLDGKFRFLALIPPNLRCDVGSSHNFFLEMMLHLNFSIGIVKGYVELIDLQVGFIPQGFLFLASLHFILSTV